MSRQPEPEIQVVKAVIFGTEQKISLGISKTHVGVEEETQAAIKKREEWVNGNAWNI